MEQDRARVLVAFDSALVRFSMASCDPSAWEEGNLLEALSAISSRDYKHAMDKIKSAQRLPTYAEISTITNRKLLSKAQLRARFDKVVVGSEYVRSLVNIA